MMKFFLKFPGLSIIEIIVAVAIFMIVASGVTLMVLGGVKGLANEERSLLALAWAEEGAEAARAIRDHDWDSLTPGAHGLTYTGGVWEWSGSSDTLGIYTRQITVSDLALNRREVSSRVTWEGGKSMTLTTRLTRWKSSALAWIQTTVADFLTGTLDDHVVVTNTNGGALKLDSGETSGTFISTPFDTGVANPNYQTLNWTQTGSGTVKFQIRTSNVQAGLHSAVWLGPDGTKTTFYTVPGTPIVTSGGTRWFQVKAVFTGNDTAPLLEDITLWYNQ